MRNDGVLQWRWIGLALVGLLVFWSGCASDRARGRILGNVPNANWPSFRGPRASGIAEGYPTPTEWIADAEGTESRGVKWRTAIPGLGHSSPIVWGDRLFITTAVSDEGAHDLKVGLYGGIAPVKDASIHTWKVLCLDKKSGKILWSRDAHRGVPQIKRHTKATHANCTMATDGRHAVAFFGSEGLYCYTMTGDLVWKKDLGKLNSAFFRMPFAQWEFASSPIIHDGKVIVQCDVIGDSFLAAFDVTDGREVWRTERKDVPTWSTPTIVEHAGRTTVVVNGFKHMGGYDVETGKPVWWLKGGGDIPTPTPIASDGLVYICNAHGSKAPIYAIDAGITGEVRRPRRPNDKQDPKKRSAKRAAADEKEGGADDKAGGAADESADESPDEGRGIAWWKPREASYMPTPIVYRDWLFVCRDAGVLSCYDRKTGERYYRQRLGSTGRRAFTGSAVAANGLLYLTTEQGETFVVRAGADYELVATNRLGEVCLTTPAISEGVLFFRTKDHLIAINGAPTAADGASGGE